MKLAIMQPYFFPYLGYFQLIHAVDRFILYDNVDYIRHGWVNRNKLVMNAKPNFITVPVVKQSQFKRIREIEISNHYSWRSKIFNVVSMYYKKRRFFDEVFPVIEKIINMDVKYLAEICCASIKLIAEFLEISTEIITDISKYEPLENELSRSGSPILSQYFVEQNLSDVKTIRALSICKTEQANVYVNAIGGQELYDKQIFSRNGVELYFIKTLGYSYPQFSPEFIPNTSIIDVLMNCGKSGTQELLEKYELI